MFTKQTQVVNETGLHARPATDFVTAAKGYASRITITNLSEYPDDPANAKSVIEVLSLSMGKGTDVMLAASGADEEDAVNALAALIESGFGE